jgi:hypothetical protein
VSRNPLGTIGAAGFVLGGAAVAYLSFVRPWGLRWGATLEEGVRTMPGDDFLRDANYETTKAITINAPISAVWPWLAQIGYQRGGLYSYDFLDRAFGILDRPSAKRILLEHQQIRTGDKVPMKGRDWPVVFVEPERALVLGDRIDKRGSGWTWAFRLYEDDSGHTRLISRSRARTPRNPFWRLGIMFIDATALIMTRKMLLNLKERAEALTPLSDSEDGHHMAD